MSGHDHNGTGGSRRKLKVLSIWHGAVRKVNRQRYETLARDEDLELTALAPDRWSAGLPRELYFERGEAPNYRLLVQSPWLRGHAAVHFYPRLFSLLSRTRPDLIDIYEEPYTFIAWMVCWWRNQFAPGTRIVFTACQNIHKRYPPPFNWMERYVLQSTDAAMALNSEAVDVFRRKGYDGPFDVVPTGIDPGEFRRVKAERYCKQLREDRPTVGYIGRLVEEKGVDTLLEAAAIGADEFVCLIVGDGPERANLQERAARLGITRNIMFVDAAPSDQIPRVLSCMDVLVLPSRTCSHWKEQLGRVLIEAMACEVAVVGSRSAAIPEVIGDAGLLFEEGDAHRLCAEIYRLLSDPGLRRSLAARGRRRAERDFSWETIADKIRRNWQSALEREPYVVRRRRMPVESVPAAE